MELSQDTSGPQGQIHNCASSTSSEAQWETPSYHSNLTFKRDWEGGGGQGQEEVWLPPRKPSSLPGLASLFLHLHWHPEKLTSGGHHKFPVPCPRVTVLTVLATKVWVKPRPLPPPQPHLVSITEQPSWGERRILTQRLLTDLASNF